MASLFQPGCARVDEMPTKREITGLVLAGGRGERMARTDKGMQLFHGKPLFLHAAERLLPQVATLLLNANRHVENYAQAGFPVVSDEIPGFAGPLAGFAVGLKHCHTPYLVTVPCDSPFFPDTLVQSLGMALVRENADLAVAVTGSIPYTPQPVFCLMKRTLLPRLEAFLQTGQRKIDAWYASLKTAGACFENPRAFYNINTAEELEMLEKQDRDYF